MGATGGLERLAVELLIAEASGCLREDRYHEALRATERALEAARSLGDLGLEVRATIEEAGALHMLGDRAAALRRYTFVLAVAEDPRRRAELERADLTWQIAQAHMAWVGCARFLPELQTAQLFGVLDAGERYLRAVGKPGWRAGLLYQRARKKLDHNGPVVESFHPRRDGHQPGEELSC